MSNELYFLVCSPIQKMVFRFSLRFLSLILLVPVLVLGKSDPSYSKNTSRSLRTPLKSFLADPDSRWPKASNRFSNCELITNNQVNVNDRQRLGHRLLTISRRNPVGVVAYAVHLPRVARPSQPWASGRNPFGILLNNDPLALGFSRPEPPASVAPKRRFGVPHRRKGGTPYDPPRFMGSMRVQFLEIGVANKRFSEPAHDAELRRRLAEFRERIRTFDPANSISELLFEALGLLRSLAGDSVSNDEWTQLQTLREGLIHSIAELEIALKGESAKAVFSVIPATDTASGSLVLDPWGGIEQETNYHPRFSDLKYWTGSAALTPVPPSLHDYIPSRYRLAEMVGLGINQVRIELFFIDAKLFTAIDYGFDITQRLRHDVIGSFQFQETGVSVETFRRIIESKSRIGTREIDLGPEVKPHKVGFKSISTSDAANSPQGTRAWEQERLDQRLALESRPVGPSEGQQDDERQRIAAINEAISRKLKSLQETVVAAQVLFIKESPMMERLDKTIVALQDWEGSHSDFPSCLIRPMSPTLFGKQMLEKKIIDQGKSNSAIQLDDLLPEQIRAATLAIAHGLLHRVPEEVQPVALEIFAAMLQNLLTSAPAVQRFKAREFPKR